MQKKWMVIIFLIACAVSKTLCHAASQANIPIYTENFKPYNYVENNVLIGAATEIVKLIIGENAHITVLPWEACMQAIDSNKKPVAVYSMIKTERRKPLYKWVGPLVSYKIGLYGLKHYPKIKSIDDVIKSGLLIGADKYSASYKLLQRLNVPERQIDAIAKGHLNGKKLLKGRFHLWITDRSAGINTAITDGINPGLLKWVLTLQSRELWIAFSKVTSNKIISQWQKKLNKIEPGKKLDILKKYHLN